MFDLEIGELERRITQYSAHLAAGMAGWLELVAEFDRREAYYKHDCVSTAEWLGWKCGVAKRAAREHVRVARRLEDLPLVAARFRNGELSYSKVRAMTRIASTATEESLVEMAAGTSASQLERICSTLRRALSAEDERIAYERRHMYLDWEDEGSVRLRGLLSGEEGALLTKALQRARELLHDESQRHVQPRDGGDRISNADALVAMAESFLASGAARSRAADRNQVIVHVNEEALTEGKSSGSAEPLARIEDAAPITLETARRLTCDASLVEMGFRAGQPLSVGRSRRTVSPAIRRALEARDGGCAFPACTNKLYVDAHHIQHWADGGETSLENLVLLCRRHHRLLHEGRFRIVKVGAKAEDRSPLHGRPAPDLRFITPNGLEIEPAPPVPRSHPWKICEVNEAAGISPAPDALNARYRGQRLDMSMAIAALCDREEREHALDGNKAQAQAQGP
jgi:hypothetical protein